MYSIIALLVSLVLAAAAAPASAQSSYRIQPGDTLQIEVLEDAALDRDVLVRPDGRITVPLAGTLVAGGRSVEQIRTDLANLLAPNFADTPNVFVSLSEVGEPVDPDPIRVYVLGEAEEPGKFEVEPGTTLLQLVAEAGGFTRFAATKRIMLRRTNRAGQETVSKFNYDSILDGTAPRPAIRVSDGDVLVIPSRRLFE